jgi:predicted DNA-binding transcriptional regulator AlpA
MMNTTEALTSKSNPQAAPSTITQVFSKDTKQSIPVPQDPHALLNEITAAAFCDVTRRCLQNFRSTGKGPQFVKLSNRCVRYRKGDLMSWIEKRLRQNTSQDSPTDYSGRSQGFGE